jgi:hypothetical protein
MNARGTGIEIRHGRKCRVRFRILQLRKFVEFAPEGGKLLAQTSDAPAGFLRREPVRGVRMEKQYKSSDK